MTAFEKFLLFVAAPAVVVFALIEALVLSCRAADDAPYDWRAFAVSTVDLVARIGIGILLPISLATPLIQWASRHQWMTITVDHWGAVLLLFLGQEFCYYGYHRAAHRVRWFWVNHSIHHSPNQLNLSAAFRIGIFSKATGTALFFVPLVWLGFDVRTVFSVLTLNLLYQFWIHAAWIPKLGWLELVLNTPSAHRVHHAANVEYLDANFGGVLIVFDRLFGTYVAERADLPCRYGWVEPLHSHNPLTVEFAPWWSLGRDLAKARTVRAVFGHLFMPPGWAPGAEGRTTEQLRARMAAGVEPPASAAR